MRLKLYIRLFLNKNKSVSSSFFYFFDSCGLDMPLLSDGETMQLKHTLMVTAFAMIAVAGCKKADDASAPAAQDAAPAAMAPAPTPAPTAAPSTPDANAPAASSSGS